MSIFIWILFSIWEFPQIILACIIIAFNRSRIMGTKYYKNTVILYVKDFPGGISLGRMIILGSKYSGNEMSKKHEYGHSVQSAYLGWLYLPIVGLPSILRVMIWKIRKLDPKGYYLGYPENWANRLGFDREEYLKAKKRLK